MAMARTPSLKASSRLRCRRSAAAVGLERRLVRAAMALSLAGLLGGSWR